MGEDGNQDRDGDERREERRIAPLEIIASAIGLLLTLAILAFIGWEALTRPADAPPVVTVEAWQVTRAADGNLWVQEFRAVNHAPSTAENVEIEGRLVRDGRTVATSRTVLSHLPGGSTAEGGLFFPQDPREYRMELRALGYVEP